MRNNIASYPHIFMKLNQSLLLNTILSPSSSPPSPDKSSDNFFNKILMQLNEWLAFFPNLINSLIANFKDTFTNFFETLSHWLAVAAPYLIPGAAIVAVCAVLFFCLPVIVSCIWAMISAVFMFLWQIFSGIFMLLWQIFSGFFMLLWRMCGSLFGMCCLCGTSSLKMMKAPGTGGRVLIPRAGFESNPAGYFSNLRAGLV